MAAFNIYVKLMTGKTIQIPGVTALTTVAEVKTKLAELENVPVADQRLIANGKQLEDNATLGASNVVAETSIALVLRLRGG